jgi:hypothetical protein
LNGVNRPPERLLKNKAPLANPSLAWLLALVNTLIHKLAHSRQGQVFLLRDAEIANIPFLAALAGTLRRCNPLV